jgi:putative phage-type endonuclease
MNEINVSDYIDAIFTPIVQEKEPEKWLELRRTGIGGSDAGAIMGLNKYASPLTVYFQKKGIDGFKGNAATEWGHILEDPIRQKAREELGCVIESVPGMYRSRVYSFMNANLDGIINAGEGVTVGNQTVSGIGGHEIKTSARGEGFTDDEIPDSYYCQVQHYMAVTGLPWFILTVFFLNSRTGRHYIVPRCDEFIQKLIAAETDFWENYVLEDKMPESSGVDSETEYLKNIPLPSEIVFDDDTEELVAQERSLDAKIKALSKEQSELKNRIICKLVENSDGETDAEKTTATAGRFRLTYSTQVRKSVDSDALKKAGLYDEFTKESSYKVLRISEVKK